MRDAGNIRWWLVLAVCVLSTCLWIFTCWADGIEEEREEKLRRARQDPFITAPPDLNPLPSVGEFYNPAEWLRPEVPSDFSQYMVQDSSGAVLGYLSLDVVIERDSVLGEFIHQVKTRDYSGRGYIDVWSFAKTFKPRRMVRRDEPQAKLDEQDEGQDSTPTLLLEQMPGMSVEYLFDRVSVEVHEGAASTYAVFRQLPYSFDREQLVLIVRQLDFLKLEWPFEAYVTNPLEQASLPFSISKPVRVQQLSAEPQAYGCFEISARLGDLQLTYWVERIPPHRLVKFVEGEHTFTLIKYLEHE